MVSTSYSSSNGTSRTAVKEQQTKKKKKKKKKGAGVLGFLTLKEPSTAAWEQFAEAEKEKARQKGSKTASTSFQGVSSQKLPEFVPKVNSKWDGLPENAKRKSADAKEAKIDHRTSTFSMASRRTNGTSGSWISGVSHEVKQPFGSLSSVPLHSPTLWDQASRPSKTQQQSDEKRPVSPLMSQSPPPALALDPSYKQQVVEETDDNRPQTFLHPPSPPCHQQKFFPQSTSSMPTPELEVPEMIQPQELDVRNRNASPRAQSPLTPELEGSDIEPTLLGVHYPELASPDQIAVVDQNETFWHSDTDPEDATPMPRRQSAFINFSRPRSSKPEPLSFHEVSEQDFDRSQSRASEYSAINLSPSLKNSSGRTDPFLTDTFAAQSLQTGHIPHRASSVQCIRPATTNLQTGMSSISSRLTALPSPTETERDTVQSPTFSSFPSESTRPSTAISHLSMATSVATAHQESDLSPVRSNSDTSLAASFASSMSDQWNMSPKERLGLGGKLKRGDALQWNVSEDGEEIMSLPTNVRRRLSLRLGSRR